MAILLAQLPRLLLSVLVQTKNHLLLQARTSLPEPLPATASSFCPGLNTDGSVSSNATVPWPVSPPLQMMPLEPEISSET